MSSLVLARAAHRTVAIALHRRCRASLNHGGCHRNNRIAAEAHSSTAIHAAQLEIRANGEAPRTSYEGSRHSPRNLEWHHRLHRKV